MKRAVAVAWCAIIAACASTSSRSDGGSDGDGAAEGPLAWPKTYGCTAGPTAKTADPDECRAKGCTFGPEAFCGAPEGAPQVEEAWRKALAEGTVDCRCRCGDDDDAHCRAMQ